MEIQKLPGRVLDRKWVHYLIGHMNMTIHNNYYKITWDANFKDEKLIGILTPQEAKELMDNIADPYKVAMALALFAGIRPMEIPQNIMEEYLPH